MDQLIALTDRIVAAINRVNTSIQKTQTYIDANTFPLIGQGTAETAGVSGMLGILEVLTELGQALIIEIAATSGVEGSLDSQPGCVGSVVAESNVIASSDLDSTIKLVGSTDEIFSISGNLTGTWTNRGLVEGEAGVNAELDVSLVLVGSSGGISFANAPTLS